MATLVLTAVGTAIGGPFGGAIGAFVGQQADRALFGGGSVEGPRLNELSVTTSAYGQPIGRRFGQLRVAGTVIWATDLIESSSIEGGKGKPKTTTYSYSANFAVALSSTPIDRLGRIWADGNLLRGALGDLKASGELRVYLGNGEAAADPLIVADKGQDAPAFRDCAYVVFENLDLTEFGNRIPALTFEIFTDDTSTVSLGRLVPGSINADGDSVLTNVLGFSDDGGTLGANLSALARTLPLICRTTEEGLSLSLEETASQEVIPLSEQVSVYEDQERESLFRRRSGPSRKTPLALRYYDKERDYQPGVQRAIGLRPSGQEEVIDLPVTLCANDAKALVNESASRVRWQTDSITWLTHELDPAIQPGSLVSVPDTPGRWIVRSWEWQAAGVELGLERVATLAASSEGSDVGATAPPLDLNAGATELLAFEAPSEDSGDPSRSNIYAAASSSSPAWSGAALYQEQGSALVPIGATDSRRATLGALTAPLAPSNALFFEPEATVQLQVAAEDLIFASTDMTGLAFGANRLLVGSEVIQFLDAQSLSDGMWLLTGLLRGRAGTEEVAQTAHPVQTPAVLLSQGLVDLVDLGVQSSPALRVAAIGRADDEAVFASLQNAGLSRRPLSPVHARQRMNLDGSIELSWTRRARGQWLWDYGVDVPLVEESENYMVGYGPADDPHTTFATSLPKFTLSQSERDDLIAEHGTADLWVVQVGTFSRSNPLLLASFS